MMKVVEREKERQRDIETERGRERDRETERVRKLGMKEESRGEISAMKTESIDLLLFFNFLPPSSVLV